MEFPHDAVAEKVVREQRAADHKRAFNNGEMTKGQTRLFRIMGVVAVVNLIATGIAVASKLCATPGSGVSAVIIGASVGAIKCWMS